MAPYSPMVHRWSITIGITHCIRITLTTSHSIGIVLSLPCFLDTLLLKFNSASNILFKKHLNQCQYYFVVFAKAWSLIIHCKSACIVFVLMQVHWVTDWVAQSNSSTLCLPLPSHTSTSNGVARIRGVAVSQDLLWYHVGALQQLTNSYIRSNGVAQIKIRSGQRITWIPCRMRAHHNNANI